MKNYKNKKGKHVKLQIFLLKSMSFESFYLEKYGNQIKLYQNNKYLSISQRHNLIIYEFHMSQDYQKTINRLLELLNEIKEISENKKLWYIHQNWPLINYHLAMLYHKMSNYAKSCKYIMKLWNKKSIISDKLLYLTSILLREMINNRQLEWCLFRDEDGIKNRLDMGLKKLKEDMPNLAPLLSANYFSERFLISKCLYYTDGRDKNAEFIKKLGSEKNTHIYKIIPLLIVNIIRSDDIKYDKIYKDLELFLRSNPEAATYNILSKNISGIKNLYLKKYFKAQECFNELILSREHDFLSYPLEKVYYNLALSMLFTDRPKKAFNLFYGLLESCSNFKHVWLRLAECCVLYYKKKVQKLRGEIQESPILYKKFSTKWKQYTFLPPTSIKIFSKYCSSQDISLEFANICCQNAINICEKTQNKSKDDQKFSDYCHLIRIYICLELENYNLAIDICKYCLKNKSNEMNFYGKIFESQALFYLQNIDSAINSLNSLAMNFVNDRGEEKERRKKNYYYLTLTLVHQNDSEQSRLNFEKVEKSDSVEYTLVKVTLMHKHGSTPSALDAIRDFSKLK